MSYYDDYSDEYSSDEEIYYHNYSVDYANQILGGQHAISSCLPLMRRKHRRHSPRLVRVSTLDEMPVVSRHRILPSSYSRPKYGYDVNSWYPTHPPPHLPTLESTSAELERRATGGTQLLLPQEPISYASPPVVNIIPSSETIHRPLYETIPRPLSETTHRPLSETTHRPLTETELRQVQLQQEAFQEHLLNMQRNLLEQTHKTQEQEQKSPTPISSTSPRFEKKTEVTYHDLERDDDQAQIAELIENDPYFAAAMEDFAHSHGLTHSHRHRTYSDNSSSRHSHRLCKRHRAQYCGDHSRRSPSPSSSSNSSLTNVTAEIRGPNADAILFRELHGIRRLMEEYVRGRNAMGSQTQPTISIMPVPWGMPGGQFPTMMGAQYPPVPPVTDYPPSMVPRERALPPEPKRVMYQNVVNAVKEVIDRRSPSQRDQPLKPSQIDPKLKYVYTKRPRIPSSNPQSMSMQRPPLPSQQRRRRSSQMTTPPNILRPPPSPSTTNPSAPVYESLASFSSPRPAANQNRNLSYGNREQRSNIYDTLVPGHYLRLYTNKYN